MTFLAWTPFVDSLPLGSWWWLVLVGIALLFSIAYKGVRAKRMARYTREVVLMTLVVSLGLVVLAAGSWVVIDVLAPMR